MTNVGDYRYSSVRGLARVLTVLFWLNVLCGGMGAAVSWQTLGVLRAANGDPNRLDHAALDASDDQELFVSLAHFLLYLVTGIGFLRFLYRANANARALGATDMTFSPGWTVGYFFVPILNLYRPYQCVKEIWQASTPGPGPWRARSVSPLLSLWWALWLFDNFVAQASFRLSLAAESLPALDTAEVVSISSDLLGIPVALLALAVVRGICTKQEQREEEQHQTGPWNADSLPADVAAHWQPQRFEAPGEKGIARPFEEPPS